MVDTDQLDGFISLEPDYVDQIRAASYEQDQAASRVPEELPNPITYDEVMKEQKTGEFFQTDLAKQRQRRNRSNFLEKDWIESRSDEV